MEELSEEQLIELCKLGESAAFEQLIKKYHISLSKYVFSIVGDKQATEDLVQEIFIKMINNIDSYKKRMNTKFSTWLFAVARNTVIDEVRKRNLNQQVSLEDVGGNVLESNDNVEDEIVQRGSIQKMREAVNSLSSESKSMIYLRYYMDLNYKEISSIFSYTPEKVKWKLHDAIQKLKKIMKVKEVNADEG